ncbi:hypothetical protein ACSSS7_004968 [Eimeria intestinalis]
MLANPWPAPPDPAPNGPLPAVPRRYPPTPRNTARPSKVFSLGSARLTAARPTANWRRFASLLAEYADRFNDDTEPLPATNLLQARINTAEDAARCSPPGRHCPGMRNGVRKAVADLDGGSRSPARAPGSSHSSWSGAKLQALGSCAATTARSMNTSIYLSSPSRVDDILPSFKGKRHLSVLDLCSVFYHIEIAE